MQPAEGSREQPGEAHLPRGAQTGGGRRLRKEAETQQVRLQVPAEPHLHRLHPLVHGVHRTASQPGGETEFYRLFVE